MSAEESLSVRQRAKAYYESEKAVRQQREFEERLKLNKLVLEAAIRVFDAEKYEFVTLGDQEREVLVLDDDIVLSYTGYRLDDTTYNVRFGLAHTCERCGCPFIPQYTRSIFSLAALGHELEKLAELEAKTKVGKNAGKRMLCWNCASKNKSESAQPPEEPLDRIADALEQIAGAMQEK